MNVAIYRQLLLCQRVRKCRVDRGLTQTEVAEQLGISQAAYSRLEKGEVDISVAKLMELAVIYRVALSTLLEGF